MSRKTKCVPSRVTCFRLTRLHTVFYLRYSCVYCCFAVNAFALRFFDVHVDAGCMIGNAGRSFQELQCNAYNTSYVYTCMIEPYYPHWWTWMTPTNSTLDSRLLMQEICRSNNGPFITLGKKQNRTPLNRTVSSEIFQFFFDTPP